jgi:hypothetical protein
MIDQTLRRPATTGVTVGRVLLAGSGLVATVVGARALISEGTEGIVDAAWWLAAGVVLHDGVLAPLTVLVGLVVVAAAPGRVQAPLVAGGIVLGTVTIMAIPVLGRFGARPDNPTLLDRDYVGGWLVLAGLTAIVVVAWILLGAWRDRRRQS